MLHVIYLLRNSEYNSTVAMFNYIYDETKVPHIINSAGLSLDPIYLKIIL